MYKIGKTWLTFFEKVLTPFWKTLPYCGINNCSMLKYIIGKLLSFIVPKIMAVRRDTCNQVKSCTKHGRPNNENLP